MSDQIDISREAVDGVAAFWWGKGYPKIADLLWSLRAALDAAEAEKARAVEAERERCAALIDCGGCVDLPCCSPADCNVMIASAIRTGAKP